MPEKKIVKLNLNSEENKHLTNTREVNELNTAQQTQIYYEDKTLGLAIGSYNFSGITTADLTSNCLEFITIVEGIVEIKDNKTGKTETVDTGESFIVPDGFQYQWRQNSSVRKFYISYKASVESLPIYPTCEHIIHINEKSDIPWQETSDGFNKKLQYQSPNKKFTAGIWQGESFKTGMITFPYNEFILLTSGGLICTDSQGVEHEINAGEALFIPQTTCCSWRSQGKISIRFVQLK
jgi:uncharacterized cupin superfamily protein